MTLSIEAAELARPRSLVRLAVLLMIEQRPQHGYDLMGQLESLGLPRNPGKTYRALRYLEGRDLVVPQWDLSAEHGPARRVYSLSEDGRALLDSEAPELLRAVADSPAGPMQVWVVKALKRHSKPGAVHSVEMKVAVDVKAPNERAARRKAAQFFSKGRQLDSEITVAN